MTGRRLDGYGRISRSQPVEFVFDGVSYTGFEGDTLASALLANGVMVVGSSILHGRPRGITTAGPEEPTAVIQVESPFPEPMLAATTVELRDGLVARSLRGQGKLASVADPAAYDAFHHHCEVLVVGSGPAGLGAAIAAAQTGQRVLLLDDRPNAGGAMLAKDELRWMADALEMIADLPNVVHRQRTTVIGHYDANYLVAVERRLDHPRASASTRERVWRIRARQVVLATGAHERHIAFAGNDVPGVMLAASVRTYLHRYGVLAGSKVILFTGHDDAYNCAVDLRAAGADVLVVDPRAAGAENYYGPVRTETVVAGTTVDAVGVLNGVDLIGADGSRTHLVADLLAVSGGWNPAGQLFSHAGGTLVFDAELDAFVPGVCDQLVHPVGSVAGARRSVDIIAQGMGAGAEARKDPAGDDDPGIGMQFLPRLSDGLLDEPAPRVPLHAVMAADADPALLSSHFVDLQRDVTVADIVRASGAGLRSVEHVKRYTTAGTAHDQAKTSALIATAVLAAVQGVAIDELGVTKYRPPYTPVSFAALAGRERGQLYDPVRTTGPHNWHVAHGAEFENVGQWKRPWYYPVSLSDGSVETLDQAVRRECTAVRENVGFMDGSTLGKIDVQGPDVGVFLDLMYTNVMSSLKVGSVRYGVMCHVDGMVLDDGTVFRLDEDRFLVTTTTGNAAKILDWMEEWLQTEWPHLQVTCTSVTEQWATMAVAGPRSRALLAVLAPQLDVGNAAMPFMSWRDGLVAGLPARVARISFSGELAFEINVAWHDAAALWNAVWKAGEPMGLTPYGTETMHVLRAEKGYPIIGQDTDGTITPQDLGMSWVVSKKKLDYIGKRSHARPDNARADRKHLVGLRPVDGESMLPEGAQIIETASVPSPPVPMIGHVTSGYDSAALGGPFALALVKGGRDRIGSTVYLAAGAGMTPGTTVAAEVTNSVLVDPDGLCRDGDPAGDGPALVAEMSSPGLPISPLSSRSKQLQDLSLRRGSGLRIAEVPLTTYLNLRVKPGSAAAERICVALEIPLPERTGATTWNGHIELVALGPDEFLLLSGPAKAAELEQRIRSAAHGEPVAVTDVSAARTTVRISGPNTRKLLAHGCSLDLDRMPPETAAQSLIAQCAAVLIADSWAEPGVAAEELPKMYADYLSSSDVEQASEAVEDSVRILVRSSFAGHLADWLLLTGSEY